jgi:hypothetical protein
MNLAVIARKIAREERQNPMFGCLCVTRVASSLHFSAVSVKHNKFGPYMQNLDVVPAAAVPLAGGF